MSSESAVSVPPDPINTEIEGDENAIMGLPVIQIKEYLKNLK